VVTGEDAVYRQLGETLQGLDICGLVELLSSLPAQLRVIGRVLAEEHIARKPDGLSHVLKL